MKLKQLALILAAVMVSATPALAQQSSGADKGTQAKTTAPSVVDFDKQMAQAQEGMKKMQEQMEKLSKTQDPQERQKLMQDHWKTMQSNMGMMSGMMGCCMGGATMMGNDHAMHNGCCMNGSGMGMGMMPDGHMMGWKDSRDYYTTMSPEQMKQRQYMWDRYMGMQQMMMNHMMEHQNQMMMQPNR